MLRILIAMLSLCLSPAFAATADRGDFVSFFDSIVGEWNCNLKQYDEAGATVWQSSQRRVISRYLADRFFVHEAFLKSSATNEEYRAGAMLVSFDADNAQVFIDGFWAMRAGRNDLVTAVFSDDLKTLSGEATATRDGENSTRRFELTLQDDGSMVERSYSMSEGGAEFLDHELIYTRIDEDV